MSTGTGRADRTGRRCPSAWLGRLLAGPVAWFADLEVVYALAAAPCRGGAADRSTWSTVAWPRRRGARRPGRRAQLGRRRPGDRPPTTRGRPPPRSASWRLGPDVDAALRAWSSSPSGSRSSCSTRARPVR